MPILINKPTIIEAAGNKPKIIEEFFGRVNSKTSEVSIAKMTSPQGWVEPGQQPEFDEYTVVLKGTLQVKTEKEIITEQGKKFLLGRFSAQADVSYGSANAKLKSEPVVFWVIPWLPLALLTTVLFLVILFRKRLKAALKIWLGKEKKE